MLSGRCRMRVGESWRKLTSSDLAALVLWATAGILPHNELATHDHDLASLLCTSQYRHLPVGVVLRRRIHAGFSRMIQTFDS